MTLFYVTYFLSQLDQGGHGLNESDMVSATGALEIDASQQPARWTFRPLHPAKEKIGYFEGNGQERYSMPLHN